MPDYRARDLLCGATCQMYAYDCDAVQILVTDLLDKIQSLEDERQKTNEFLRGIPCPKSAGFEGVDTYPECGECPVCLSKTGDEP